MPRLVPMPATALRTPFVLVPCDNRTIGHHPFHVLGKKYTDAIHDISGCLPLIVPTSGVDDISAYVDLADGVLLTGSPSNVHPSNFGQPVHDPRLPLDPLRDAITLPLIRESVKHDLPILAICRGMQEINVALGGSLLQAVHELEGQRDHRYRDEDPVEVQYGPVHEVRVVCGGLLHQVAKLESFLVNSAHGQGIDRIAPGLMVEAVAPDGLIEAVRIASHPGFALGVQWHPEWRAADNPVSTRIFERFGEACRIRQARRLRQSSAQTA
ncbi:MAG TPA: gamma-glutamyl-gamma-aminobutyrate hydrolase family protein [Burkholderiaceae bacterium]|nr:gamma-glutamyl-gamma-aminobutyrate hydrolase family protein [Burkholderiaceae bacterium]